MARPVLTLNRWRLRAQLADPAVGLSPTRAVVAASKASHMSYAVVRTLGVQSGATNVPATLPLSDIVAKLNELQPTMLSGYPTMLTALAHEAQTGRLRIQPRLVTAMSEPVLAEMRSAIGTAWNCPLLNYYGCSEGASAGACRHGSRYAPQRRRVHLRTRGQGGSGRCAGTAGGEALTPLFNKAMPLIRYELTDADDD